MNDFLLISIGFYTHWTNFGLVIIHMFTWMLCNIASMDYWRIHGRIEDVCSLHMQYIFWIFCVHGCLNPWMWNPLWIKYNDDIFPFVRKCCMYTYNHVLWFIFIWWVTLIRGYLIIFSSDFMIVHYSCISLITSLSPGTRLGF